MREAVRKQTLENPVEIGQGHATIQFAARTGGAGNAMQIPHDVLAHVHGLFPSDERILGMPVGHGDALFDRPAKRLFPALQGGLHAREKPRIALGGSSDHHRIASGVPTSATASEPRRTVAVADDGNGDGLLDASYDIPVGGAAVELGGRAAVHRHRGGSRVLRTLRAKSTATSSPS